MLFDQPDQINRNVPLIGNNAGHRRDPADQRPHEIVALACRPKRRLNRRECCKRLWNAPIGRFGRTIRQQFPLKGGLFQRIAVRPAQAEEITKRSDLPRLCLKLDRTHAITLAHDLRIRDHEKRAKIGVFARFNLDQIAEAFCPTVRFFEYVLRAERNQHP